MKKELTPDIQNQMSGSSAGISINGSEKIIHGLIFSAVVIVCLGFASMKLSDPMTLPIRHVSINGDFSHLSPVSLQERASSVVRGGFFNVNVETIKEVVSEEPWVKEIMVRRDWPDRIIVHIKEQQPIAKWKDNGLINQESFIFYPDISTFPEDLPFLSGPENSAALMLGYLFEFNELIPKSVKVKKLYLSNRRSWELTLDNDFVLQIGKTDVLERAKKFFSYYSGISEEHKINYVDLRYTNGFVIGWQDENKSGIENGQEDNG